MMSDHHDLNLAYEYGSEGILNVVLVNVRLFGTLFVLVYSMFVM